MRIVFNLLLVLVLASGPAAAQDRPVRPAEYLVTMPLAGLVSRTEERAGATQTDWLPPGVPADQAARMVTVNRISGAAGDEAPERFLRGLATCLRPCPGQTIGPIGRTPVEGHAAARVRIDIPVMARTGGPGTLYALAVSGDRDLHVVVVAFRGQLTPADDGFAQDVLRTAVLCTQASRHAACRSH